MGRGRFWTDEDICEVFACAEKGMSYMQIANLTGRTPEAIRGFLRRNGRAVIESQSYQPTEMEKLARHRRWHER